MKDAFYKLKILYWLIMDAWSTWKKEVWKRDLNEHYCCPGGSDDYCACGGTTVRDIWSQHKTG